MRDLNSTMFFVKVVVAGSFTRAAAQLGVPKSTVSDKVAQLERDLEVTLLTRTTRKLKLTDVGEEFFRKAEAGVTQLQVAGEEAAQAQRAPTGLLRISAPSERVIATSVLDAVTEYRKRFANVRIELDFSDRYVDLVGEGYDIAIRAGELTDSGLKAKRIGAGFLLLAASPEYLRKAPPIRQPRDLARHACLRHIDPPGDDVWHLRAKAGRTARVSLDSAIASNSFQALKSLAVMGQGIALMPNTLCQEELVDGTLRRVLPEWATPPAPFHLVYPAQRFGAPKVREMLPLLAKSLLKLMS